MTFKYCNGVEWETGKMEDINRLLYRNKLVSSGTTSIYINGNELLVTELNPGVLFIKREINRQLLSYVWRDLSGGEDLKQRGSSPWLVACEYLGKSELFTKGETYSCLLKWWVNPVQLLVIFEQGKYIMANYYNYEHFLREWHPKGLLEEIEQDEETDIL